MNLFDIIPQNYFGLFGGKNRSIYIDSLLILFNLLESDETIISKSDFLKALKEKENNLDSFEYEKEDLENLPDDVILQNTLSSKASFICKRLEETGWIDVIMDPNTFEETIILPQYSILLLKCLFYYWTIRVHSFVTPSTDAVIRAVPFFHAVTRPWSLMVATLFFLDFQTTSR